MAAAEGMKSLREDGIDKVLLGMTSVEEIARVIVMIWQSLARK